MIMVIRDAVETLLSSSQFELLNQAVLPERLKIAIDCAEANPGQPPANEFINFAGRWVLAVSLQLLQNHLALPRYSQLRIRHDRRCPKSVADVSN